MWSYFIAFSVGVSTVLQGTLNRWVADKSTLAFSVLLNAIVFLVASAFYYAYDQMKSPGTFKLIESYSRFEWWMLAPGILGIVIVAGVPAALEKVGATKVFVLIVCSQLIMAMAWDFFSQGTVPGIKQIVGVIFAVISVWLMN